MRRTTTSRDLTPSHNLLRTPLARAALEGPPQGPAGPLGPDHGSRHEPQSLAETTQEGSSRCTTLAACVLYGSTIASSHHLLPPRATSRPP
ncbi:hypothetical protein F511_14334 [Dorcoceras hygrometricum]|uniref:Uncharacterized protein n=1 Tax=Dorcoceras hygrometricum TaxID=472368 RepID=A0A2Z7CBI2_9LAMI|nr:hypothetical protein F511_14334 [Dorcoceras hygrometricum]